MAKGQGIEQEIQVLKGDAMLGMRRRFRWRNWKVSGLLKEGKLGLLQHKPRPLGLKEIGVWLDSRECLISSCGSAQQASTPSRRLKLGI